MKSPALAFLALALAVLPVSGGKAVSPVFQNAYAVLEQHCFKCHSHASGKSKGGLLLDSREALLIGGETGAAIVPGDPAASRLLKAVSYRDPDLRMPPKDGPITAAELLALNLWVHAGAPWPQSESTHSAGTLKRRPKGPDAASFSETDRNWWAFQAIKAVSPPVVKNPDWMVYNDVDRFLNARLEAWNLAPAPEAAPAALIRRVTFDLIGLPPTPTEVAAFLADASAGAYERLVDRLLASPHYGERMARAWLDLVRYADSDGYRVDDYRPDAWRYRDYVIAAFNTDKPYTRFIQEQLAGDELFPDEAEAIVATGYLRHWIYEYNARDVDRQWDTILNDLTDTTGDVFLGLGLQCARCHDHKFDPILQKDYYRLRAFFAAFQPEERVVTNATARAVYQEQLKTWEEKTATIRAAIAKLEQPYLDKAAKEAISKFPENIQAMIHKPLPERNPLEAQIASLASRQIVYEYNRIDRSYKSEDKEAILALRRDLAFWDPEKPAPLPIAPAAGDVGTNAPPVVIPKKAALGVIEPGVLTILTSAPMPVTPTASSTGRRSALANWLTSPENPFTARVLVNRVWQQHFGRGLAANPSDFGILGEKPTHPELLNWLAGEFMRNGWSLKKLHRLLVTSAAYRRSAEHPNPELGRREDPENRLLWRWQPRRLDAEQIRDALLAVSGELQPSAGGPGVTPEVPKRTIYTRFMRNNRDALADVFDAPFWFTSAASRDTTTTPVQSLLLANGDTLRARGRAFAARLEAETPAAIESRIQRAYSIALGRTATANELTAATAFLTAQAAQVDPARLASGQANFSPGKLPYRDGQAAFVEPEKTQTQLSVNNSTNLSMTGSFTVEAYIVPRTVADTTDFRTIAAKHFGKATDPGWSLGITGAKSPRRPLTLALPVVGLQRNGQVQEHVLYSDLSLQLNKPYFVAAVFTPAQTVTSGKVLFVIKDLANDDEPVRSATVEHEIVGPLTNAAPVTLGARSGEDRQAFHGLIDDVRLSNEALPSDRLLYVTDALTDSTLGFWRFEAKPDVFEDSSGRGHPLRRPPGALTKPLTREQAALGDYCHALLNSSEFLYTE